MLFGRLRSKAGSKFQGKASAATRSSIILRFLAGCQTEELGMFIDLLLEPVSHHGQGPEKISTSVVVVVVVLRQAKKTASSHIFRPDLLCYFEAISLYRNRAV